MSLETHGYLMERGKHKGERITRVPVSYLKWMVRERAQDFAYAAAELERRGTVTPTIEISGHAIDSASLRCRKIWHETRNENEGLHAWLCRMAQAAREFGTASGDQCERRSHEGMIFVFEQDGAWPLLKTIMREKNGKHDASRKEEVDADG